MEIKYLFVVIYILIDIAYITLSAGFYSNVVKNIQGTEIILTPSSYISLVLAYIILAFGWMFIVADRIDYKTSYTSALFIAFMYAITVYGVFNTTLYVLFEKWDIFTALRDTTWGVTCITSLTLAYLYAIKYQKI